MTRRPTATGGHFSVGYLVEHLDDGRPGYLKAMDYSAAFQASDTIDVMKQMSETYVFERDLCLRCRDKRLKRVMHAVDHGTYVDPASPLGPYGKVEYLIFERADGDIRGHLDQQERFDGAFVLRTLHNVAAALGQLHRSGIAHQDLKPSNVLVFGRDGISKVGDLGRAWAKDMPAPHDNYRCAGDLQYAPLELFFGAAPDEDARRFGCDLYLLGSLIVFFFTRVHVNSLIGKHLAEDRRPAATGGTYAEFLPYATAAFGEAIREFKAHVPDTFRDELGVMAAQLCDPDPRRRGHPMDRGGNRYSLERYISRLDYLAFKAEAVFRGDGS